MILNYLLHLRPKSFVPSFMFVLTGYAINPHKGIVAPVGIELLWLFVIYSVLLFGGTCAINSHYDQDTGPLNFLENPPPKPRYLGSFGFFVMILGCILSWPLGIWVFSMSVFALILSSAYSVRVPGLKWRGKEVGGLDNLINALGCGFVGVIMGATLGDNTPNLGVLILGISFTITVAGSYPATQIFQLKASDDYSVARNFTTLLGPSRALSLGAFFLILGLFLILVTQTLFLPPLKGWVPNALFFIFMALFIIGVLQVLNWSNQPFDKTKERYKKLVITLLGARLFWIAAEWMIHSF